MQAMTKILAGGVVAAALFTAAPAAAQYYPRLSGLRLALWRQSGRAGAQPGAGRRLWPKRLRLWRQQPGRSQPVRRGGAAAPQRRLREPSGYGSYSGYSYYPYQNAYPGGRVLGISRVEPRSGGGLTVRGVASSGSYAGAYGSQQQPDLTFEVQVRLPRLRHRHRRRARSLRTTAIITRLVQRIRDGLSAYGYRRY